MTRPASEEASPGIPWHLKLLGVAFAIYLSFRAFEAVQWFLHR
jgi:hypothetical protein